MPITPGPWHKAVTGDSAVFDSNHTLVADCDIKKRDVRERLDNAKAIAAVPEMVDALRAAEKVFYKMAVVDIPAWRMVRDALTKAEGRE